MSKEKVKNLKQLNNVTKREGESAFNGRLYDAQYGVEENSRSEMDTPDFELKATKANSNTPTTCFTKAPEYVSGEIKSARDLVNILCKESAEENKKRLYVSMRHGAVTGGVYGGFYLESDSDYLYGCHEKGGRLFRWSWLDLGNKAQEKMKNVRIGTYDDDNSLIDETDYSGFDKRRFFDLIKSGEIKIETRITATVSYTHLTLPPIYSV